MTGTACPRLPGEMVYLQLSQTARVPSALLVSEMPDAKAASVISLAASGGGGIQDVVTTQAFTTSEARALFEQAGRVASSYKPMGAS